MQYKYLDKWQHISQLTGLQKLSNPPAKLYIRGHFDPQIFANCVAVVGSRRMTEYGKRVIEKLVPQLVLAGKTIVSGFMYGVDQYAHQVCLDCGGRTIAVLGWGINIPLEDRDTKLAEHIIYKHGILLSEWLDQKPTLWTFPVRNRLVVALSQEVYIIEATLKSGSLLTAQLALKQRRKLWAIPGPITSRTSMGTNTLILRGEATMWLGSEPKQLPLFTTSSPIVKALINEALTANELALKLDQPVANIGAELSMLTITGQLTEKDGKYYLNDAG